MKSIRGSTDKRELNAAEKERTDGSLLNKTTVRYGDKASHDLTARSCLAPTEPLNGLAAEKMVIVGEFESL